MRLTALYVVLSLGYSQLVASKHLVMKIFTMYELIDRIFHD